MLHHRQICSLSSVCNLVSVRSAGWGHAVIQSTGVCETLYAMTNWLIDAGATYILYTAALCICCAGAFCNICAGADMFMQYLQCSCDSLCTRVGEIYCARYGTKPYYTVHCILLYILQYYTVHCNPLYIHATPLHQETTLLRTRGEAKRRLRRFASPGSA